MIADGIVRSLKNAGVDLFSTLPCEKARPLYNLVEKDFRHVALAREEEGVGISAGAFMAGAKPAMLVQSSGVGNMINALCSLTKTYEFPLLVLASWRGVYKEQIVAQIPLGIRLQRILQALDIDCSIIENSEDVSIVKDVASNVYEENKIHAILLNPKIWEETQTMESQQGTRTRSLMKNTQAGSIINIEPKLTRFEIFRIMASYLSGKIVVCNLGIPSKELYRVKHQKTNFYMLGSMGSASPIGLGISLFATKRDVVVIDGDGSLLTNLGALSTIAHVRPRNLSIFAIDNGVHGSTGDQPTATSWGADLGSIAKGSGFEKVYRAINKDQIQSTIQSLGDGPNFVHVLAKAGNANVPNIPLTPVEIKKNVVEAIRE